MSLVGGMESWDWHGYKAEVLFWWGLIVSEISIEPKQAMLRPSYFTWSRNIHPLLYVYLVPDEPFLRYGRYTKRPRKIDFKEIFGCNGNLSAEM